MSEKKLPIPILAGHDPSKAVGKLDGNIATFIPGKVTQEMVFSAGWIVLEAEARDGVVYVRKARITYVGVDPNAPPA